MTQIVNLRSVKKRREAARKRAQADANAAKFGRTRAERVLEATRSQQAKAALEAHRRETDP